MGKKSIENINIEKNKELFEYEMTDVILKLKGEFASFSGKGTKYEDNKVAEESLKLELYPLESVSLEPYKGEVPDAKKFSPVVLNGVRIELAKIDDLASQVEAIEEIQLSPVPGFKRICIDVPQTDYQFDNVQLCVEETGRQKEIKVKTIPELSFLCDTFVLKQESVIGEINLPDNIDNVRMNVSVPNVKIGCINVDVPTTTIRFPEGRSVNIKRIVINLPGSDIKCLYNEDEIKTEKYHIKTIVQSVKLKDIEKVNDVFQPNIKEVDVPKIRPVSFNPVDTKKIKIIIPDTDIESHRDGKIEIEKKNRIPKVPNIPVIKKYEIGYRELIQKKFEEVTIPHFGSEYFKINKIEMSPVQRIEIPSRLEVSDDIDRLISLATS